MMKTSYNTMRRWRWGSPCARPTHLFEFWVWNSNIY